MRDRHPHVAFGLVTDIHFSRTAYGNRDCPGALERLRATLSAFTDNGISLVINLGDAIDDAPTMAVELALCAEIRAVFDAFPGTVLHVIGNHDVAMFSKAEYRDAIGSATPPYYRHDDHGVRLLMLDGNCHADGRDFDHGDFAWDDAWIAESQIAWLTVELAATDRPVLICCHECLDESTDDPHVVRNAAEIRRVIRESGTVRGVFQGHYHPGRRRMVNDIPFVTIPSVATGTGCEPVGAIAMLTEAQLDVRLL